MTCLAHKRKGAQRKDDFIINEVMIIDETTKAAVFCRHFEKQYTIHTPPTDRPNDIIQLPEKCSFRLDIDQVKKAVTHSAMGEQLVLWHTQ